MELWQESRTTSKVIYSEYSYVNTNKLSTITYFNTGILETYVAIVGCVHTKVFLFTA